MIRERRLPGLTTVSWMDGDPIRDNKSLEPITSLDVSPSGGVEMDDDPMRARREGGAEAAEGTGGRKGPFAREGSKVTLTSHPPNPSLSSINLFFAIHSSTHSSLSTYFLFIPDENSLAGKSPFTLARCLITFGVVQSPVMEHWWNVSVPVAARAV